LYKIIVTVRQRKIASISSEADWRFFSNFYSYFSS